jgi:hypothetical protein
VCAKFQERPPDLLIKIKPKLHDRKLESGSLVDDLYQVATLAESFTTQRPRSNKNWGHLTDALDREGSFIQHMMLGPRLTHLVGVTLWNTSGLIRQGTDADSRTVVAACMKPLHLVPFVRLLIWISTKQ